MQDRLSRRAFTLSAIAFGAGVLTPRTHAAEKSDLQLKIGVLQGMFRDAQPAVVRSLAKPFREVIQKQTGFTGAVEVCADPLAMVERLREKELHIGVFHGFEFAWAQQLCPELLPLVVAMPAGNAAQAVVVVNRDCKHTRLADFVVEPVAIPRGAKAHAIAYFQKARAALPEGCAKPLDKPGMGPDELLRAVASGEQAAALVDVGAYEGYQALQPGAFKLLKVLDTSEVFPPAVVAYRKGSMTDKDVERLRDGLATANRAPSGKMMMLWNLKGFEAPPADYQTRLDAILKAYPLPASK